VLAGEQYAHRVGQKKPNAWGLYDIYGNVSEWCRDLYAEKLPGGRDPEVTEKGSYRVPRGGHWYTGPRNSPSAFREGEKPLDRSSYLGFRVALSRSGKN
jgi:formylglycine-generating enzyme required for sulfatase activity